MFGLDFELLGKDPTESNFKQNQNLLVHVVKKPEGRVDWILGLKCFYVSELLSSL